MEVQLEMDYGPEERIQLALHKAKIKYDQNNHYSGASMRIVEKRQRDGSTKIWYATRTFNYDVDWDYWFELQADEADAILKAGLAHDYRK